MLTPAGVSGTGSDNKIARWDGTASLQTSLVSISDAGIITQTATTSQTNSLTTLFTCSLESSGTVADGFGSVHFIFLDDDAGDLRQASDLTAKWVTAAAGSRKARAVHSVWDLSAREYLRGESSGAAAMIGFLGASAALRQTGDVGTALVTFGLMSGTPTFAAANLSGTVTKSQVSDTGTWEVSEIPDLSSLYGFPRGYIDGLILSNDGSDPSNDWNIAAGAARDSTNAADMVLSSGLTKRLDAAWAVGTNQGGLDTGSEANSTWYHIWLIKRPDTGVVDCLASTSATAPTMPTNYTLKRRVGSIYNDGSSVIRQFKQFGDLFLWDTAVNDTGGAGLNNTSALYTLSIPGGVRVKVELSVAATAGAANIVIALRNPDCSDPAIVNGEGMICIQVASVYNYLAASVLSNTSSQIRARSNGNITDFYITTRGWTDSRGRDA